MISATGKVLPVVMEGRERAVVSLTKNVGAVSKATVGTPLRDGVERIWLFPSAKTPL